MDKCRFLSTEQEEEEKAPTMFSTNIDSTHKALVNHVIKRVQVASLQACVEHCIQQHQKDASRSCKSFNLAHDRPGICEVNAESREKFPADLKDKRGYQYYRVD